MTRLIEIEKNTNQNTSLEEMIFVEKNSPIPVFNKLRKKISQINKNISNPSLILPILKLRINNAIEII